MTGRRIARNGRTRSTKGVIGFKAGIRWHGWHAFRRGLATNLHRLGVSDETIQRILRHSNVAVTQGCYIKTVDCEVRSAMQQFERSLEYAPNMHLSGTERTADDVIGPKESVR